MKKIALTILSALAVSSAWAQTPPGSTALAISNLTLDASAATGLPTVNGLATNTTNATLHYAAIVFNVYDGNGDLLGNTIAVASNVSPGDRWKFSAPVPYQTAQSIKAARIDAN
ncbi:FxLYD domain-containing protein [Burkholderia gladioli]|uniref:FxLYD domain-containing protein n=1 Tax=Burkholderia gladioli TaxID=28095 RepID=UPI00163F6158|nr:FxLYD domain-containing protein [Burkholderia gladioli]